MDGLSSYIQPVSGTENKKLELPVTQDNNNSSITHGISSNAVNLLVYHMFNLNIKEKKKRQLLLAKLV